MSNGRTSQQPRQINGTLGKLEDPRRGTPRLYNAHYSMVRRCTDPSNRVYRWYGQRGITVCPEFLDYETYRKWFRDTFKVNDIPPGLSLDRTDNNGDYEPGNMRLATNKEQHNNTSANRILEYNGEKLTVAQWAEKTGIGYDALRSRLRRGWSVEQCLTAPVKPWRK